MRNGARPPASLCVKNGWMWTAGAICERVRRALQAHEDALRLEQAVKGLDALSEVALHAVLASGLASDASVVLREVPYPGKSAAGTLRRERDRCDLVLLPQGETRLIDPLVEANTRASAVGTLFADLVGPAEPGVLPEAAYWLETKVVGQMTITSGWPGPNRAYASELVRSITIDLRKLASQPGIEHGALLLVVFTDCQHTAEHDVVTALERCAGQGVPMRTPEIMHFPMVERMGNANCTVTVVPRRGD